MNISTEVVGLSEVLSKIDLTNAELATKTNSAIQGAGIECQAIAKQLCPVDTGRLRNSILYHPGNLSCTVDTNVFYSIFIELGTRHMSPRPFLYPAYQQAGQHLIDKLSTLP